MNNTIIKHKQKIPNTIHLPHKAPFSASEHQEDLQSKHLLDGAPQPQTFLSLKQERGLFSNYSIDTDDLEPITFNLKKYK